MQLIDKRMPKVGVDLTKFCFDQKYTDSYLIVSIDKKPKMSLFANNRNPFTILINKLIGNIVEVNTKYIYVFQIKRKRDKNIQNIKVCKVNWYINLNCINKIQNCSNFKTYCGYVSTDCIKFN